VIDDFEYQVRFLLQPLLAGNDPRVLLDAPPVGLEEGMLDGVPVQVDVGQRVSKALPDEDLVLPRLSLVLMTADASLLPRPVLSCMFRARWVSRWRSRACSSRSTSLSTSRLSSRTDARSSGRASTSRINRKSCRRVFLRRMCMSLRLCVAKPPLAYACKKTVSGWLEHRWTQSRRLSAGLRRGLSIHEGPTIGSGRWPFGAFLPVALACNERLLRGIFAHTLRRQPPAAERRYRPFHGTWVNGSDRP
jgi:hypothetical protein